MTLACSYVYIVSTIFILIPWQSLEEQLRAKEGDCMVLESTLTETKRKNQLDKDLLKRATKQHKERAMESTQAVGTMTTQLELAVSSFSI